VLALLGAIAMTDHDSLDSQIFRLTIAMFAAAPGAAVLAEQRNALTGGESVENLAHNLVRTDVYKLLYPDALDTVEFSARFALDVLRAEVGPVQMAYAIKELAALQRDGLDRAQTVLRAIDALLAVDPANSEWGNARQAFENKLTVAAYYSVERQKSAHSLAELQKVVALVTSNPCSVQAAKDQIDGVAPSHVVLLVSPCLLTDTGVNSSVHAGGTTRDNTVSIAGTVSDPRAVTAVEVLDGSLVLGTAIVAATGDWRFTTPPLADGDHTLTVRTVGAGCHAVTSLPLVFRVDTSSPVDAPSGTLLISGTVAQNSVLTAIITGVTDPDSMGGLHFQWLRNGSVISGATSQTYTLGDADVGKVISVRVSYTDGQGTPGTLTSAPTEFPAPPPVASLLIATQGPLSVAEHAEFSTTLTLSEQLGVQGEISWHLVQDSATAASADWAGVRLDSRTGQLALPPKDYEHPDDADGDGVYRVQVYARDSDGLSSPALDMAITVTDLNDNAPVFTSGTTGTVAENAATTTAIYTATTSDSDGTPANRTVVYSLKPGTGEVAALNIDGTSGAVTLKESADYETKASYSFTVVATNGSLPPTEQAVTVNVTDLNDNAPVFSSGATGAVAENAATTTAIYTAATTDADGTAPNRTVVYSLKPGTGEVADLHIDGISGAVTLKASADFETKATYSFTVVATNGALATEQAVTITVTDLNDNAPIFTSGATGTVEENAATTTVIYTATTTDADGPTTNRSVVYSLKADTGDVAALDINADTGVVTLKASADFETKASYTFTVVATNGSQVSEREVTVNVTDLNDNAPIFTSGATGTVEENAATTTVIYTATTTDADGPTTNRSVVYSLKAATGDVAALNIDATSGVVTLKASADFETKATYSFTVVATNGSLPPTEQAVTVNVTNMPTVLEVANPGPLSVNENTAFSTTLALSQQVEVQGSVTWHLVDGSAGAAAADGHLFVLNSATGTLTLSAQDYERPDDADADHIYRVQVFARDGAGTRSPALSLVLTVDNVVETTVLTVVGAPVSPGTIFENTATTSDAAVVARLQVSGMTDVAADVLSWHLVVDDRDDLDNARFTLGISDGILRLNRADFEQAYVNGREQENTEADDNDYTVRLVARDIDGNESSPITVRARVVDDDDELVLATQSISAPDALEAVDEHTGSDSAAAIDVAVLTFTNAIGLARWSLSEASVAAGFTVTVGGVLHFTPPDREASAFDDRDINTPEDWVFTAEVTGTDDDGNEVHRSVSVRLDNVPEGTGLSFKEAGPTDATVEVAESMVVPAAPVKILSLQGAIGTVTWELTGPDKNRFQVGSDGISLNLVASNFETGWTDGTRADGHEDDDNAYSVTVKATDRDGQQITQTFAVTVTDAIETPTGSGVAGLAHTSTVATGGDVTVNADITESTTPVLLGKPVFTGAIGAVTWRVLGLSDDRAADFDEEDVVFDGQGRLLLKALDFESPGDKTGGSTGGSVYRVGLVGLDSDGNERQVLWTLNLVDRPMAIAITTDEASAVLAATTTQANGNRSSSWAVNERLGDDTAPYVFNAALDVAFDAAAGDALVWAVDSSYKDHALFTWDNDAKTLTLAAKDRESLPSAADEGNVYSVRLVSTDKRGDAVLQVAQHELLVTIADVYESRNLVIATDVDENPEKRFERAQGTDAVIGNFSLDDSSDQPIGRVTWALEGDNLWLYTLALDDGSLQVSIPDADYGEVPSGVQHFTVRATDLQGNTTTKPVAVELLQAPFKFVTPTILRIVEGAERSLTLNLDTLPSDGVTWSVQGGSDLENLLVAQPGSDGVVRFKAQDYENPLDTGADRRYFVTLLATSDKLGYTARLRVQVLVEDLPIAINPSKGEVDTDDSSVRVLKINENVAVDSDDAIVTALRLHSMPTGDALAGTTLRWLLEGDDKDQFELVVDSDGGGYLRFKEMNFESDPGKPNQTPDDKYHVTLVAEDKAADGRVLQTASQAFRVEVQDVDEPSVFYGIKLVTAGLSDGGVYNWDENTPIALALAFNDGFGYSPPNGEVQWELTFTNSTGPLNIPFTRSGNNLTISPLDWESLGAGGQINLSIDAIDEEGTRPGELWFDDWFAEDTEAPIKLGFNIQDVNERRTLTIQGSRSVLWNENDTTQFWVPTAVDAQVDAPGPPSLPATPYSYSKVVSGTAGSFGADHALFVVNATTGAVTLAAGLNRERPSDANGDNLYHLTLRVDDADGNFALHNLAVEIAGVDETTTLQIQHAGAPLASAAPFELTENNFFTTTMSAVALGPATDRGALHWSLEPGAPAGLQIEESTGVLSWIQPNYEATTGGTVTATVRVTDSDIGPEGLSPNEATQTITLQIADNDYEVEVAGGYRQVIAERSDFAVAVSLLHDSLSINQAGVAWSLTGEDANDFVVSGGMLRWNSAGNGGLPDFEAPKDGVGDTGGNNVYQALLEAKNTSSGEVLVSQFIQLSLSNLRVAATVATTRSPVGTAYNTETVPSPATLSGISFSNPEEGGLAEVEWDLASMTAAGWNLGGNASIRSITGTSTLGSFSFEPAAAGATTGGVITYYVNPSYAATEAYRYLAHFQGITDRVTLAVAGGNSLEAEFRVSGVEDRPEIPAPTGGGTAHGVVATVAEDPSSPVVLTAKMLRLASGATDPDDQDSVNVFVVTQVSGPGTLLIGTSRATATPWRAATDTDPGNCQIGQREEKPQNLVNDSYDYYIGYWIPDANAHGVLNARVFAMEAGEPVLFTLGDADSVTAALAALNKRSVHGFDAQVEVTAVNDAPELTLFATEVTVEANGTVPVSEDLLWSDPDDATPAMLTVQLTGGYAPGVDSLSVAEDLAGTGLQAVWNATDARLVISAVAGQTPTELDWTNVLESIQYANTNPDDTGDTRQLRFIVQDPGGRTDSVDLSLVFETPSAPKAGQGSLNPVLSDELVQIVGLPDVHAPNELLT
jgi:hypothetical protein